MMQAVQRGSHQQHGHRPLEPAADVEVAVLEDVRETEQDLEDDDPRDRCPQQHDDRQTNR
jgi:hypothetical protein